MGTVKNHQAAEPKGRKPVQHRDAQFGEATEEDERSEVIPFKYSITSYGADYTVDGLVKRINEKSVFVPSFQRGYVWKPEEASRFVESLLLGLPVPGIFLSKEKESQRLLVIDGQQRLVTLQSFYRGMFPDEKLFKLCNVQKRFLDKTYKTLEESDRIALDDSILHATIVKQDNPQEDNSSVYYIFERLNTGGVRLESQEIRACVYHGALNDLISALNRNEAWRTLYGHISKKMRDQEMILRFFALYSDGESYKEPMKAFLNDYMSHNRNLAGNDAIRLTNLFTKSAELVSRAIGPKAFKPARSFNAAVCDSVLVGVARRLTRGPLVGDDKSVVSQYRSLLDNGQYVDAAKTGTGQEEKVRTRLTLATNAFSKAK